MGSREDWQMKTGLRRSGQRPLSHFAAEVSSGSAASDGAVPKARDPWGQRAPAEVGENAHIGD